MGILSNVGKWVFENTPTVINIGRNAEKLAHKSTSLVDALLEGKTLLTGSGGRKKTSTTEDANDQEHQRILLRIDLMDMAAASHAFELFSNSINLHAANLQIHLQVIQNTEGLLGDINRQRVAVKALMGTVNHLVNVLGLGSKVNKIEGLDIDIRLGAISILGAHESFEDALNRLMHDIDSFLKAIQKQSELIEKIRSAASPTPAVSQKINSWLDASIAPKLVEVQKYADELKDDLLAISCLDAGLRRELKAFKQDNL